MIKLTTNTLNACLRLIRLLYAGGVLLAWCMLTLSVYGQTADLNLTVDETGAGELTIESPFGSGEPIITVDGVDATFERVGPRPKVQILIVTDIAANHIRRAEENVVSIGKNLGAAILTKMGLSESSPRLSEHDLSLALAGSQGTNSTCRQISPWTRDDTETFTLVAQMSTTPAQMTADLRQAPDPIENDLLDSCLAEFADEAQEKILLFVGDGDYAGTPRRSVEELRGTAIGRSIDIYPILIRSDVFADYRDDDVLRSLATDDGYTLPALDTPGAMTTLINQVFDQRLLKRTWRVQIPNAVPGQSYTVSAQFPDGTQNVQTYDIPVNNTTKPDVELDTQPAPYILESESTYKIRFNLDHKGVKILTYSCRLENASGLSLRGEMGLSAEVCEFSTEQMNNLLPGTYQVVVEVVNSSGQPDTDTVSVTIALAPESWSDIIRSWLREGIGILVMIFTAVLLGVWYDFRRFRGGRTSVIGTTTRVASDVLKSINDHIGRKPPDSAPPPGRGHAKLVCVEGVAALPKSLVLTDNITVIGSRNDTSTLILDDGTIAARQCSIERKQGRYALIPHSQEHPTFLGSANDLVQLANVDGEYNLDDDAYIGFGSRAIVYRFEIDRLGHSAGEHTAGAVPDDIDSAGDGARHENPRQAEPEGLAPLLATLTLVQGNSSYPGEIEIRKESFQFGRATQMDNDVVLNNDEVSGVHCRIVRTSEGSFELIHVGNSNPSYVASYDDKGRLAPTQELTASSAPVHLPTGAIIGIFDIAYYRIDYTPPRPAPEQDAGSGSARTKIRTGNRSSSGTNTHAGKRP